MGNRISISFKKDKEESVTFFSHWDGKKLVEAANKYVEETKEWIKTKKFLGSYPLGRLEPNTVILDFIKSYTKHEESIYENYYLGKDKNDGDNSDNGHFIIKL